MRSLDDAGVARDVPIGPVLDPTEREAWLRRLNVEFREALASSRLYETTTVPGFSLPE